MNIREQSYFHPPGRLTLKRIVKDKIASTISFEPVIRRLGYTILEKYKPSTCMVYKVTDDGNRFFIAKAARRITPAAHRQVERENELLELLGGHAAVPAVYSYHGDLDAPWITVLANAARELTFARDRISVLIRQYIRGHERRTGDRLTPFQRQSLANIISSCHESGFAGLGIDNPRNIIYDADRTLYFIDFGTVIKKSEVTPDDFASLIRSDHERLESISKINGC